MRPLLPPDLTCPFRSWGPTPEIVRRESLALAKPHLQPAVAAASEDIDGLAAAKAPAFFVPVMRGSIRGSDMTIYDVAGVFLLKNSVLVVKKVTLVMSGLPPPGHAPDPDRSRIEILSPRVGHIQIVHAGSVVDHFIDLERGVHLLALESPAPARAWKLDGDAGAVSGDCQYPWDE